MKTCVKCKKEKTLNEFTKDKYNKDGFTYDCKLCRNAAAKLHPSNQKENRDKRNEKHKETRRKYYAKPENKIRYKDQYLKRLFGIGIEEYNKLFKEQNGLCAICYQPQASTRNKAFAVDHSHKSGIVRGLLCDTCNRALGLFKDNKEILQSAINYLEKTE